MLFKNSRFYTVFSLLFSITIISSNLGNGIDSTKIELIEGRIKSNWIDYQIKKIESITQAKIYNFSLNYELVNYMILNA